MMTEQEFIDRWNSDAEGGGITLDDVADCAQKWGLVQRPRIRPVDYVLGIVLKHLGLENPHDEKDKNENDKPETLNKERKTNTMALSKIITGIQPEPFRLLIHGVEGIGKSQFSAQAPDPIFIQTEDGLGQIDVPKFPLAESFETVMENLNALLNEQHDYQTVVIDSIDWLEKLATQKILAEYNQKTLGFDYSTGYKLLIPLFESVINLLNRLRRLRKMNVVLVAHTKLEKVEDPSGASYDQYAPRLDKRVNGLVKEWVDIIAFATHTIAKTEQDEGFNKTRTTVSSVKDRDGNDRVLYFESNPAIVAKSRYTSLPAKMPLDGEAFFAKLWEIIYPSQTE